jgi:glyoxylase-like metal-dependent hydrolase (beta-lactamase superfamily II)
MIEITDFEEVTRIRMSQEADGKPVYWVAAYLVDGLLVDTGCAHTADELVAALEGRKLDLVVNTHFHEDHVGADHAIMERFGVPVFAHRDSVPLIGLAPELNPYQEYVWGYPQPAPVSTLGARVDTGEYHFEVIETPGHSAGHVALFERKKGWCFTGDIFITERPKVIRADEDAVGLMGSMRMLAALPSDRLVLFTSMGKVIEDGRAALLACADYFQELMDRVRGLQEEGLTPIEIRERVFGEGSSLAVMTGGHFSSDNLIASLMA